MRSKFLFQLVAECIMWTQFKVTGRDITIGGGSGDIFREHSCKSLVWNEVLFLENTSKIGVNLDEKPQ